MPLQHKHLLGIEGLAPAEIEFILDTAASLAEISTRGIKKVPTLRGKTVINLFFEPSTRTRTSFEIAAKRLSADVINFSVASSSVTKGESFRDTVRNLQAMNPDIIVIRHFCAGAPHQLAKVVSASIINAGDGSHEHPTQALVDLLTIREKKGTIKGLNVVIIGDISHSRVARSNIFGLTKLGARVKLVAPKTLIPLYVERLGVAVAHHLSTEVIATADVIIVLRLQLERQQAFLLPSLREYATLFGLTLEKLQPAKKELLIMHPGPINRGIELAPEVADGHCSVILDQVTNGIAIRMALMYLLLGGES